MLLERWKETVQLKGDIALSVGRGERVQPAAGGGPAHRAGLPRQPRLPGVPVHAVRAPPLLPALLARTGQYIAIIATGNCVLYFYFILYVNMVLHL